MEAATEAASVYLQYIYAASMAAATAAAASLLHMVLGEHFEAWLHTHTHNTQAWYSH